MLKRFLLRVPTTVQIPSQKPGSSRHTSSSGRQALRPTIGSQVVIQSKQEKLLKKIYKKEDKRLARQQAKERLQQEDHLKDFDPAYLKKVRYGKDVK